MLKQFAVLLLAFLIWNWSGISVEFEMLEIHSDSVSTYDDHSVLPVAEILSAVIDEQEEDHEVRIEFNSGICQNIERNSVLMGAYLECKPFSGHLQIPILLKSCCLLM